MIPRCPKCGTARWKLVLGETHFVCLGEGCDVRKRPTELREMSEEDQLAASPGEVLEYVVEDNTDMRLGERFDPIRMNERHEAQLRSVIEILGLQNVVSEETLQHARELMERMAINPHPNCNSMVSVDGATPARSRADAPKKRLKASEIPDTLEEMIDGGLYGEEEK
jgi:hypothetical protein